MSDDRPESDIRKRAAWLLAMLAVVAGLLVLLSLTLFNTSGGGGTDHGDIADPPPGSSTATGVTSPPARGGPTGVPGRTPTSPSAAPSTSGGPVPRPSCPGSASCTVRGDVAGAMAAINAYRAKGGKKAVPTTSTPAADRCALSSGNDCPRSFVWVRVPDLSGAGVVKGVTGFNSNDDLLDNSAKSFAVGWAYDPGSRTVSCALIRND